MTEDRLTRIESKIDELSKAFVILARAEEKLIIVERDRVDMKERLGNMERKVDDIENVSRSATQVTNTIMRIFWLLVAGLTGAFALDIFKQ